MPIQLVIRYCPICGERESEHDYVCDGGFGPPSNLAAIAFLLDSDFECPYCGQNTTECCQAYLNGGGPCGA